MTGTRTIAGLSIALLALSGSALGDDTPESQAAAGQASAPPFVDVTAASNIHYQVGYTRPPLVREEQEVAISTNGGVAAGDCDNDGDIDLFITYGNTRGPNGGGGPNRLYLNQLAEQGEGLVFEDFAKKAGVAITRSDRKGNDRHSGPAFADMDGDGDLDLFLGGIYSDPSKIYENDGDCRFTDVTSNSPEIEHMAATQTISAGFGDYDLDGDLDMFLTHWGTRDTTYGTYGTVRLHETEHLWRNESDESGIRFVNVSEESGISDMTWSTRARDFYGREQIADFTFTPTFARINDDVWPDIAIAADFGTAQVAINNGDGTFSALDNPVLQKVQYAMGSALGDFDNDGDLDWFVTSIFGPGNGKITPIGNRFYTNDGGPLIFADATKRLGVEDGSFGWGACMVDIDNDTDLDIYHTNGWPKPYLTSDEPYPTDTSRLFVMNDAGTYTNESKAFGLDTTTSGRGVVCADFDNDGDIDILELTDARGNSARLWEDRTAAAGRHSLRIRLEGLPPNTEASGARIIVRIGDKQYMREITIGSNYASQNPRVQIFGLGSATSADEILVEWPPLISDEGPKQLGTLLNGPIAASRPGETLVLRHPGLPPL